MKPRTLLVILWLVTSASDGGGQHSLQSPPRTKPPVSPASLLETQLGARHASGVLLDWNTGTVVASTVRQDGALPGSLLKPFLLAYALRHDLIQANTRVYCRRTLRVAGRALACTHPADLPLLDAEGALAASCNTWFASLAQRMPARDVAEALREAGFPIRTELLGSTDARVLTALGLRNAFVTPMQVAAAYRKLLLREERTGVVWNGLRGSVAWGMAGNARVSGADVLGKTGTASDPDEWWTHGWFAGAVPGRFVLVVYVPRGDGGMAATLAGAVLRQLLLRGVR